MIAPDSDQALAARVMATRDQPAFEVLVRRHERHVLRVLTHLTRNPVIAEDLAQDTFVTAWEKIASYRAQGPFAAWVSKLAVNRFLHFARRQRLERKHAREVSTQATIPAADELPDLERLLNVVSREDQILLTLVYAAGFSFAETASLLEIPVGTIKSKVSRAKTTIQTAFHLTPGHQQPPAKERSTDD